MPAVTDELVRALHVCVAESDGARRLSCYDQALKRPGDHPTTPEQRFGLSPEQVLKKEQIAQGPKDMTSQVAAVSRTPHGPLLLTLANGQVWEETNPEGTDLSIAVGDSVTLRQGALGGFMLTSSHSGNRTLRVKRVK
jgi:hypothetical protein